MSEKRRGLGRGLGALIPSGSPTTPRPPGDRPIDVFFPGKQAAATAVIDAPEAQAETAPAPEAEAQPAAEAVAPGADAAAGTQQARGGASAQGGEDVEVTDTASADTESGSAERVATPVTEAAESETLDAKTNGNRPSDADPAASEPVSRETTPDAPSMSASEIEVPETVDVRDSTDTATAPRHGAAVSDHAPAAQVDPPVQSQSSGGADQAVDGDPEPRSTVSRETTRSRDEVELVPVPGARFAELPVGQITPNPKQPRSVFDEEAMAELVHSIREIGVLQPIVVRPVEPVDGEPRYELIMGERRWRATQEAGLAAVPAIIRETQDDDLLRDALLENLHRSQLNPLEEAAAYSQLLEDFGCTHEDLATRIGRSRPQISNTLRLLRLPPLVQRRVAAGVLSAGHARALLGLEDGAAMERLAQRIVAEGLSVRSVEEIVAMGDGDIAPAPRRPRAGGRSPELDDLASRLSDRLDTRVKIALGRSKGRLTVEFASVEDLNRILGVIAPQENGAFRGSVED